MNLKTILAILVAIVVMAYITVSLGMQSIRLDEAQSVWLSTKPFESVLQTTARDVHTPLYFTVLHFWMKFFGNSVISIRMLSFVFYLLSIPIIYSLVKFLGNTKTALFTAALFSISPFVVWYSFEARMYTMLIFFSVLSHYFFVKFIDSGGKNYKTRLILTSIAGIYTHYFFVFLLLSQAVFLFIRKYFRNYFTFSSVHTELEIKRIFKGFIEALAIVFVFFSPWIFYMVTSGAASNTKPLIPAPDSYSVLQTFVLFIFGYQSNFVLSLLVSFWPLLAIFLFLVFARGRKFNIRHTEYFLTVTFFPLIALFLISFVIPVFLPRYVIFVTPTLFLLLSVSLEGADDNLFSYFSPLFLGLILLFLVFQTTSTLNTAKEDYRGVASFLTSNSKSSDIIVVSAPFTVYPIEYYYKGKAKLDTAPYWNRVGEGGIPPFDESQFSRQIGEYRNVYDRMFVVLSYDQGYEENVRNYLDNNYELLERKKYSEGLELNLYKLSYDRNRLF